MTTTPAQLAELLAAPEGTRIEFKSATGGYHFDPAGVEALSPEAIAEFRSRWARKARNPRIDAWTAEEVLTNAELIEEGKVLYAALILFGTRTALGRHLPQAEVVFEYRSSEASGPAADRAEFREGFFLFHDA